MLKISFPLFPAPIDIFKDLYIEKNIAIDTTMERIPENLSKAFDLSILCTNSIGIKEV